MTIKEDIVHEQKNPTQPARQTLSRRYAIPWDQWGQSRLIKFEHKTKL